MGFQQFIALLALSFHISAAKLSDYSPYDYQVLFTNPECKEYKYETPVQAIDGSLLESKPKCVYCKNSDLERNALREDSPHFQLIKLISDKELDSLFFAFLSFSNDDIANEICDAIKRNIKVSFVIDSKSEYRPGSRASLDLIGDCRPENLAAGEKENLPETFFRGNKKGIGYAHNKMIIARYKNSEKVKLVYGSGNMSSGTVMHHENWHFVTTNKRTFLAQSHHCVKKAMIQSGNSKSEYKRTFQTCREEIEVSEEEDIQMMAVPSDGKRAMRNIVDNMKAAKSVGVAAHRFTHPEVIDSMMAASQNSKRVRLVTDDDIYWSGVREVNTGFNMFFEYLNVIKVVNAGVDTRYMESNQNHRLLHHNKYIVFNFSDGSGAVHTGAGNFTKAAFSKNMENYYFISIASVVEAFRKQYEHMFEELATPYEKMPAQYVMP